MKNFILLIALLFIGIQSSAQDKLDPKTFEGTPIFTVDSTGFDIDLGKVHYEDSTYVEINFSNTGTGPLILSNVRTSCSCTEVTYSKDPILPGGKGRIGLWYKANHDINRGYSQIRVHYNSENSPAFISLTATIVLD